MQSEKSKQLLADIAKSKEEINSIKKELSKKIQDNFHGLAKELFNIYPELTSIGWEQYTPYFNDGEECTFRSHHDDPNINGVDCYGDRDLDEGAIDIMKNCKETYRDSSTEWKDVPNPEFDPYYKEIVDTVRNFLSQFDDDDMLDLFDNHVSVKITAEGFSVEEYEHD